MWVSLTRDELRCGELVPLHPLWAPVVCHYCWKYDYYSGIAWHLLRIQGLSLHSREKCNYLGTRRKKISWPKSSKQKSPQRPSTTTLADTEPGLPCHSTPSRLLHSGQLGSKGTPTDMRFVSIWGKCYIYIFSFLLIAAIIYPHPGFL